MSRTVVLTRAVPFVRPGHVYPVTIPAGHVCGPDDGNLAEVALSEGWGIEQAPPPPPATPDEHLPDGDGAAERMVGKAPSSKAKRPPSNK